MGMYDYKFLLHDATAICAAGAEYTTNEVNFGVSNPNQKSMSLYLVVTTVFSVLTSLAVWVVHGAATAPTTSLITRYIALASLTKGAKFEVPIPPTQLQYLRARAVPVGGNPTGGACTIYLGPSGGGDQAGDGVAAP